MKRILIVLMVLITAVSLAASFASAKEVQEQRNPALIGLWEGIDPNDGSLRSVSITDNDRDGVYELLQYDTFWTLCGDGRALAEGSGTVGTDGVLIWSGTLTCFTSGSTVDFSVSYEPVRHSDLLIEQAIGIPLLPSNLHRVSSHYALE